MRCHTYYDPRCPTCRSERHKRNEAQRRADAGESVPTVHYDSTPTPVSDSTPAASSSTDDSFSGGHGGEFDGGGASGSWE